MQIEGTTTLSAKVGQPVALTVVVKDDGIPKPPPGANPLAALFGGPRPAASEGGRPSSAPPAPAPPAINPVLLKVLSGRATAEERAAAAESLGVSDAQLDLLIAARRNPGNESARPHHGRQDQRVCTSRGSSTAAPAKSSFSPEQVKTWEDTRAGMNSPWAPLWTPPRMPADGKLVAQATFSEPGTYVLKALADDGGLTGYQDVTVTVTK